MASKGLLNERKHTSNDKVYLKMVGPQYSGEDYYSNLPAVVDGATLQVAGQRMALPARSLPAGALQVGVRPEYLALSAPQAAGALQCRVAQVQDIGTYQMLTAQVGDHTLKARVAPEVALPAVGDSIWLQVLGEHTCFYQNEELLA